MSAEDARDQSGGWMPGAFKSPPAYDPATTQLPAEAQVSVIPDPVPLQALEKNCLHCGSFHEALAVFRCESCCWLVCERQTLVVEETGFRIHFTVPHPEAIEYDYEEFACGLAVLAARE